MTLAVFQFQSNEVRVLTIEGEPWFVASDVLRAIGSTTTVTAVEAMVREDLGDYFVTSKVVLDHLGRGNEMLILAEAALTMFVSRSRTPMGKAINRWIHAEVLPTIRKTGRYEIEPIAQPEHQLPATYIEALEALLIAEKEKEALMQANELLSVTNGLLQEDIETLSEVVDELFDYSSIVRIAKFNGVNEKIYSYHTLKAASKMLNVEIKKAPCPRYVSKNLYSHDAWRLAYPDAKLPETTTLTIARNN